MTSKNNLVSNRLAELPRRTVDLQAGRRSSRRNNLPTSGTGDNNKLIVGADISLSGDIKACESLIVEGTVEATLDKGEELQILKAGIFKGNATVDIAIIEGKFEGELTVRERLTIKAIGRVKGRIGFKEIEIDLGGQIDGEVQVLNPSGEIKN